MHPSDERMALRAKGTVIVGGTIVPIEPAGLVMSDAAVGFSESTGRILEVGVRTDINVDAYGAVIDVAGAIVMPGLINAHGHGVHTLYRGSQEMRPLELWRQYVKARDRCITGDAIKCGMLLSAAELLLGGCTTTLEHFYSGLDEDYMGADHVLEAWADIGIRGVLAPMLSDVTYMDTVGLSPDGMSDGARAEAARISASEGEATLESICTFISSRLGKSERVEFLLGPSAPHRCSAELIEGVAEAAERLGIGWHMHVAETRPQFDHTVRTLGTSPVGRLNDLGVLSERASLAHVVHCTDQDLDALATSGATVVHNPASNMKLGSGIARVPDMLTRGIPVALGTDGSASNDGQSMGEAMKLATLLQGVSGKPHTQWLSAADALSMATIGGAKACGLEHRAGVVEPGRLADLVVLRRRVPGLVPLNDPLRQLVFGNAMGGVDRVFVGGREVVRNGRLTTIDQDALFEEAIARAAALSGDFARVDSEVRELEAAVANQLYRGSPED